MPPRLDVRHYQAGDLAELAKRGHRGAGACDESAMLNHRAWSLLVNGHVAAVAAIITHWPGYGTLSAIIANMPDRVWARVRRLVRETLHTLQDDAGEWRRIDATVAAGDQAHLNFARALGFRIEGLMEAYGPDGEDMILVARVRRSVESKL